MDEVTKSAPSKPYKIKTRYWLPVFTVLLGVIVLAMLLLSNSMRKRQHQNYILLDSIEDVQIHTSLFHLWLEEYLAGDRANDLETILSHLGNTQVELHIMLEGGLTPHGKLSHPPKDPLRKL